MNKLIAIISFLLFFCTTAFCQTKDYNEILNNFVNRKELKNAGIGIYAENLGNGNKIMEYNSNLSLIPASVFKIFPTSIALEMLGADHKFKTELAYSGNITAEGTLNGNIYIIGYGDPCLGSLNFSSHYNENGDMIQSWVNAIKKLGIKKINGNIIGDISYFGKIDIPDTWIWEDIGNYYGHPGSALNYYDNLYYIHFTTGQADGSKTTITKTVPPDIGINFDNQVTSSSKISDDSYIYFGKDHYDRIIKGTLPWKRTGFVIKGSMPEPELHLTRLFSEMLKKNNVSITGTELIISEKQDLKREIFHTVYSPSLQKIAEETNVKSNNLYAEVLAHHISKMTGKNYKESVDEFLKSKRIDIDGLNVTDACGLSHFNTLTARQMTDFLKYLRKSSPQSKSFFNTLPVAGTNGTISKYFIGTKSKMRAKSGSMTRIRSYAGYITDSSGNEIVFCFMVNNYNCNTHQMRKIYENFFKAIAED